MCILLAVMLTDVVLLDVFNSMGMPTSTTVSLVFELLGGTFALSLIKVHNSDTLGLGDLINTDKALSVIMAIFVSVAIAFFFGMIVQWLARVIFTFNYTKKMKYSIALFGGVAATAIIYFMLIKGLKDSSFMTPENKHWIQDNTLMLIAVFFVFFTVLMQILHWMKINVFKVIVLMGTFALALAFAGNDLVNFIGVPLAGFSSPCAQHDASSRIYQFIGLSGCLVCPSAKRYFRIQLPPCSYQQSIHAKSETLYDTV